MWRERSTVYTSVHTYVCVMHSLLYYFYPYCCRSLSTSALECERWTRLEPRALQLETPPTLFLRFCSCRRCQQFGVQMAALASGRCWSCQRNFKRNILGSQRREPSRHGDHVLCKQTLALLCFLLMSSRLIFCFSLPVTDGSPGVKGRAI